MSKIIQIIAVCSATSFITALDEDGVIWTLSDSSYGVTWHRKIGSPEINSRKQHESSLPIESSQQDVQKRRKEAGK